MKFELGKPSIAASPPNLYVWLFFTQVRLAIRLVFSSSVSCSPPIPPLTPKLLDPPVLLAPVIAVKIGNSSGVNGPLSPNSLVAS